MLYGATNNPRCPVVDEIKAVADCGFDYLELCLDPPFASPELIKPAQVKAALDGEGLGVLAAHLPTFVWLADIYEGIRQASVIEVIKALEFSAELGIRKAVLHPGYITGMLRLDPSTGKNFNVDALEIILDRARQLEIVLCLENMFPRAGQMYRPEEFIELFNIFPDLMMTLDLAHARIQAPPGRMYQLIEAGAERIKHVHISDHNGKDDDHLPVGVGLVDAAGGLAALKRLGYDESMTIEVFSPDRDYLSLSLKKVRTMWEEA